jgi:hypothetical protein
MSLAVTAGVEWLRRKRRRADDALADAGRGEAGGGRVQPPAGGCLNRSSNGCDRRQVERRVDCAGTNEGDHAKKASRRAS